MDPEYRRLRYCRYADDHVLGFTGPKAEAEAIKDQLAAFLRDDLKLQLSQTKTLVTHARTSAARFLGYEITVQHASNRRAVNGKVQLRVPLPVIKAKCAPYLKRGKPAHRPDLMNHDDHTIVNIYGAQYRGIVNYYLLANDVWRFNQLDWVAGTSMLKTLAAKHRSTVTRVANKYKATLTTPHGPRRCFQASIQRNGRTYVATFGGIPLKRQRRAILTDRPATPTPHRRALTVRVCARQCEWCGQRGDVEVHHVHKLADLTKPGRPQPAWAQIMAKKRQKTLVVCQPCHDLIHDRHPTAKTTP